MSHLSYLPACLCIPHILWNPKIQDHNSSNPDYIYIYIPCNYSLSFRSNTKTCGCISFQSNTSHMHRPSHPPVRSATLIVYLILQCFLSYVFSITPTHTVLKRMLTELITAYNLTFISVIRFI